MQGRGVLAASPVKVSFRGGRSEKVLVYSDVAYLPIGEALGTGTSFVVEVDIYGTMESALKDC